MNNNVIKYGITAGVGVIAYFLLFYFTNSPLLFHPLVNWGCLVIYLFFMIRACRQEKKSAEGTYTFQNALRTAFGVFAIANFIYYIYNYLLFKFDPTLLITQKEAVIQSMEWAAQTFRFELPEQDIQRLRGEIRPVTIGNSLLVMAQSFIGGFLLSLIVALLITRRK